ncbi:MAG: LuxR C-terminal-related transcriptional regulator [Bacillota bacterium]|nr:LuxR C-terminal-related transcriptional regulator [Bacillota bacterium]
MKIKKYNTKSLYFTQRLLQKLDGIRNHPLTIVEAPMGYGKTTAVKEYLAKSDVTVLWLNVYNDSTEAFWEGFTSLLGRLDSGLSESLSKLGVPDDAILLWKALKLIEDMDIPSKTAIVIDDYHLIDSPDINKFIETLAENTVENLHIVLNVRYSRFERLEEFSLKRLLLHITKDPFELAPDEIIAYYKACVITLTGEQAQQLYEMTEGWISALYLLMLEYTEQGSFTPETNIYALIEKAVYLPLSDEIKEFIVSMCIFDSFTLQQAEYMWGNNSVAGFLASLTGSNSFIYFERSTKAYHFHSIFTGLLKEVLEGKEKRYRNNLYQKAAQWYIENRDYMNASRYFYECGNFDGILLALELDQSNNFTSAEQELLKKYMAECPQEIKIHHPYAQLIYAMNLFVHGELTLFHKTCSEISIFLSKDAKMNQAMRNRILGELELMLSFSEFNDLKKMSIHHRKAWELLNQPTSIYNTEAIWTFGSPSVLSLYYRESSKLQEHIKDIKESMPYYYLLTNGHGSGAEYAMEAESLFNQGDLENAEISAQKAMLKAQSGNDDNIVFCVLYLRTLIAFMKGDLPAVMDLIHQIHETETIRNEYYFIHMAEICEGNIYAYLDQKDKIPERLLDVDLCNSGRLSFPALAFFNIMYGRILLIKGEYLKLIGSAEHFINISSVHHNLLGYIYTYIYLAAAYRKIFREDDALNSLKKALDIAMPDRQYMLFVENCDYIEPLLHSLSRQGLYREEIEKILELYKTYAKSKAAFIRTYFTGDKPKLTERETETARLAVSGLTNQEIAEKLFISPNTVKATLKSIYVKGSIHNRVQLKQYVDVLSESKKTKI